MKTLLFLTCCIVLFSCSKKGTSTNPDDDNTIVYNYTYMTYVGTTSAHFEDNVNSQLTTWDTTYTDTLKVKVDSAKDRVVFTVNEVPSGMKEIPLEFTRNLNTILRSVAIIIAKILFKTITKASIMKGIHLSLTFLDYK